MVEQDPNLADNPLIQEEVRALLGEDVDWLFRS
jgi:hypothetical protein